MTTCSIPLSGAAFRAAIFSAGLLAMAACDEKADGADVASTDAAPAGLVGAWGRYLRNDVGPKPLQVFELRPEGVFITHGPYYLQDRGRYSFDERIISVQSDLNPALKGDMAYRMVDDAKLFLELGPPLNQHQEWHRIAWQPFFAVDAVAGRLVPMNIKNLVAGSVWQARQAWKADAVPERLELEAMKNGEMELTLDLYSPSDGQGLRQTITRFARKVTGYRTPAGRRPAFAADFLDLPEILRVAQANGYDGQLKRASILTTNTGQSTWGFTFTGGKPGTAGLVLDAVTGEKINYDMNEVMADYNQQWDEALAGLRTMMGKNETSQSSDGPLDMMIEGWKREDEIREHDQRRTCEEVNGGRYANGGCF